ncbi:YesL family protein [Gracilibacillus salinarum]|uniref:YesL family protein n=1 Tax=Gracilibacillus salinarum TaxID=2932255 RepID=A0ABY4GSE4_9BACI|nr:YesL family protein [Gracilibacillus salinarum]UOQ87312.1 YesL family protein [Gracilibacillus salinarum]
MFGKQIVNSFDQFLHVIIRIAWLNFLWILFTLIGVVAGGIFPATTASISVARKWIQKKEVKSVYQAFKQAYRQEFIRANMIGYILVAIAAILFVNYQAILQLGDQIPVFVVFAYYFVIFLFSILALWIFPLLSHYKTTVKEYFKNALIIGITKMPVTITMALVLFIILYVSLELPTMLLFCTVSLIAVAIAYLSVQVFEKIDKEQTN